MRRFRFPLETVRRWREAQLEMEESRLQNLFAELRAIESRLRHADEARAAAEREVLSAQVVEAQQLAALEAHRLHLAAEKERLKKQETDCAGRIAAQRQRVVEAERRLRLMDKLKEHRLAEWDAEFNREQEALSTEVFLAQWKRG